jgi:Spy/CpxP family protein refolding chaperone
MKAIQMKTTLIVLALATLVFTGCRKEKLFNTSDPAATVNNSETNSEVDILVNESSILYLETTINEGSESIPFSAVNDGLIEDYMATTAGFDASNADHNSLVRCLKSLNLSEDQIAKLRRAFAAFEDCKAADIKKHRAAYEALKAKVEAARQDLVKKLRNNEITKAEFEKAMKSLRQRFQHALAEIKRSFAKDLKECHRKFLAHIKEILTERQWAAFVKCHKH